MSREIYFINLQSKEKFLFYDIKNIQKNKKYSSKYLKCSRYFYNDILSHNFKIEQHILNKELNVLVEIKMFEELGLNIEKSYKFDYYIKENYIGEEKLIEGYAIEKEQLLKKYNNIFKKEKFFDIVIPPFLAYETLYKKKILKKNNEIFIYISIDEAFFTFYQNGKYISSHKIKSISEMIKDLETKNIQLELEQFIKILKTKGLKRENYDLQEFEIYDYLYQYFNQLFSKLKNLAFHNRNMYGFNEIENIYFYLERDIISGIDEFVEILGNNAKLKNFNFFENEQEDYNILDILTASYIDDYILELDKITNLTILPRSKPFFKTEIGKYILYESILATFIMMYPIYLKFQLIQKEDLKNELIDKKNRVANSSKIYQNRYISLKQKEKKLENKLNLIEKKYKNLRDVASTLIKMKSNKNKYTNMLLEINKGLKKYHLVIDRISQIGDRELSIVLSSKINKRDKIALFMKDFLNQGYKDVKSDRIYLKTNKYQSKVILKR